MDELTQISLAAFSALICIVMLGVVTRKFHSGKLIIYTIAASLGICAAMVAFQVAADVSMFYLHVGKPVVCSDC